MKKNQLLPLLLFLVALTACQTQKSSRAGFNTLTKKERAAGWQLLFDGKSIDLWHGFQKKELPSGWQVEDHCLTRVAKGGDLATNETFKNFELTLEWKISEAGNSGIFFHVSEDPKYHRAYSTGPEMQILDDDKHPDAKDPIRQAGATYNLLAVSQPAVNPVGTFNKVRIKVVDGHVQNWLNDKKVGDYQLLSPEWEKLVREGRWASSPDYGRIGSGPIVLQDHDDKVWFRNIKIRRL
ncbi:uncharacterized protein DUF1080 [Dyadobacter jejuensis]|uniref:Uncharacterized protein DUF1080 n=1 Tax=Dyadobacter jejuensis TaxID=1082580 RepID=A0A316AGI5_9BACT|nr:DUF1080 domain-containing protein [Dyadobacter jejuensis]PWJ56896.1 uncharacterized protein DUF1080 [Dyadobacter jejuensis]